MASIVLRLWETEARIGIRRAFTSAAFLAMLSAPAIAADLPFGQHVSTGDQQLVMKQLGPSVSDLNPKTDLDIAKVDLNGDGRPDYVVVIKNALYCGSAGCPTSVYLSHGNQYRNALPDLLAQGIALGNDSTDGVRDLMLDLRLQTAPARWTWNGTVYTAKPAQRVRQK